jgi:hypothetical protein
MLFTADAWPGIADGSITLTFRTWTRAQAKVGGSYRVAGMLIEAVAVDVVDVATITDADARRAGAVNRDALLARLGDVDQAWRIEFRHVGDDDRIARRNNAQMDADELIRLRTRLARLDRDTPWTTATLRAIADHPGTVSTALAELLGRERFELKADIRKLKELGLTESLRVGYRLSPRGQALLDSG